MREKILFDDNWLFHRGDVKVDFPRNRGGMYTQAKTERKMCGPASKYYTASADGFERGQLYCTDRWENVTLPHDYVIFETPNKEENNAYGYLKRENAWYRKKFVLSSEDIEKRLTLIFDGVATHATVYLNGCLMKHNFCGYTTFEVDISDVAQVGENLLAVYVNNDEHEGWWYEGGGIYRHVWLCKTDKVAVDLWGVYVVPKKEDETNWSVKIQTELVNDRYESVVAKIVNTICDKNGKTVACCEGEIEIPAREKGKIINYTSITSPDLWDIDSPNLYKVTASVFVNDVECDRYETRTGFRTVEIDPDKGLFLNGKHVKIKGLCAHQDFGITGKAVADNVLRYKARLMKEMGANGFRTSHYPHTEATMDALDELGFLVMDETRWFESTDEGIAQLEMLIKRDRNRPSVIFWSIGNEEPHHLTEVGRRICKSMMAHARKLDDTRFIMTAVSDDPDRSTVYDENDVLGINYNLGKYEYIHKKYPTKGVFASECCATGTTRGWYNADCPEKGYISAYDKDTTSWFMSREDTWKFIASHDWILGEYQWTAFEHRGETVWPRLCSVSGAIDMFLQKKDAFYQNLSHWSQKPMIHLLPHWSFAGREGEKIPVWAYTNCEKAELFLDGESLGVCNVEKYSHAEWQVEYKKGTLTVVGYNGGKEVCRDEKITSGKATKLNLRLDNDVTANGADVAIITCYCTDENGIEVPDATPYVSFYTNGMGKVIGTGSSNTDHHPPHLPERKMYAGKITVAVRVGDKHGLLKVYAESECLISAVATIEL